MVAAFALVGAATQLTWLTFAPVTTVTAEHYDVSESAIGWLANVFPLVYVVLAIPAGIALDRWFTAALSAGAVITALGAILRLVGDDFAWVLTGQTLIAVAQPLVLNAIIGITGRYLAERDRAAGIAVASASTFAGMIVAFLLGAVLAEEEQLTALVAVGAVFSVVAAIVLVSALRTPPLHTHEPPAAGLRPLRSALNDGFIRRVCLMVFFPFGCFIALTTFAQPLLDPAGVSAETTSVILLLNVVAGVVGCAVLPVVAAKHGWEARTLAVGACTATVGCMVMAFFPNAGTAGIALVVIGFVFLPALPLVLEVTERITGEAEGTASGLIWMSGNLGGLTIASVVGALVDHPTAGFAVAGVAALLALPALASLRPYLQQLASIRS
ncbi:MFS transporter [Antrihabitans sp. YC2-6]|nr:MFS transporter [Antrihabitans sp. YC2-6]